MNTRNKALALASALLLSAGITACSDEQDVADSSSSATATAESTPIESEAPAEPSQSDTESPSSALTDSGTGQSVDPDHYR